MHAITDVISTAYNNVYNNNFTGLIFLDIKKAFDTVKHDTLIKKLEHCGIRGNAQKLIQSYLTGQTQYVAIGENSQLNPINWCVP